MLLESILQTAYDHHGANQGAETVLIGKLPPLIAAAAAATSALFVVHCIVFHIYLPHTPHSTPYIVLNGDTVRQINAIGDFHTINNKYEKDQ